MKKFLLTFLLTAITWAAIYFSRFLPESEYTLLANALLAAVFACVVFFLCLVFIPKENG